MGRKYNVFDGIRFPFVILSNFDLITPLFKGMQWVKNDPPLGMNTWTFLVPNTESIHKGWSHQDIKRLLKENGINVYGDQIFMGQIQLRVPISQATKAESILNTYHIPIKPGSQPPRPQGRSFFDPRPSSQSIGPVRCAYCGSFDLRKGKCHNCGAIS